MKKSLILLGLATLLFACGNNQEKSEVKEDPNAETQKPKEKLEEVTLMENTNPNELPILLGKKQIQDLKSPPHTLWYAEHAQYNLNQDILRQLVPALENKTIEIFLGTWCADSRRFVPPFISILEAINFDENNLTIIGLSRDKDTPENFEKGKNIDYVPTFIVYENNKEIGRIVEFPIESLEEDLLKIATGQDYKHAYE